MDDRLRIAVWGSAKSGKSSLISRLCGSDAGICNVSAHFSHKLNREFYIEWLEIPELKSETTLKLLLGTCQGVVLVLEAFDMNQYTVNQYTSVIQSMHQVANFTKSYSESPQTFVRECPVLVVSSKTDIYAKASADMSKFALIHNIEEVAVNLLSADSFKAGLPKFSLFIDETIEEVMRHSSASTAEQHGVRISLSRHRLEINSSSSMGSLKSIPDVE